MVVKAAGKVLENIVMTDASNDSKLIDAEKCASLHEFYTHMV